MTYMFYASGALALLCTSAAMVSKKVMHGLIWLVASFISLSLTFFSFGAELVGSLEIIVYAGAIMVLFVFATMLIGMEKDPASRGGGLLAFVCAALFFSLVAVSLDAVSEGSVMAFALSAKQISRTLYSTYGLTVELASFLLLAALVGAYAALKHAEHSRHS